MREDLDSLVRVQRWRFVNGEPVPHEHEPTHVWVRPVDVLLAAPPTVEDKQTKRMRMALQMIDAGLRHFQEDDVRYMTPSAIRAIIADALRDR
jgi:hypothetical protein